MSVPGVPLSSTVQVAPVPNSACQAATRRVFVPVTLIGRLELLKGLPGGSDAESAAEWTSVTKVGEVPVPPPPPVPEPVPPPQARVNPIANIRTRNKILY